MIRSNSSNATVRVRTAWFPIVVDVNGSNLELHIGWKYSDGSIGLYSAAGNSSKTRPPWGCVMSCSFERRQNKRNESNYYMVIKNRAHSSCAFKCLDMNPVLSGVNDFTSRLVEMRAGGREKVLAIYLDLMVKSTGFSHHKEGVHDNQGFNLDKSGLTEETLVQNEGSARELRDFLELASKCALMVHQRKDIIESIGCDRKKRKNSADIPVRPKLSKMDKIVADRRSELLDPSGLEIAFQNKFVGRAEIPLKNLEVSTKVSIPLNNLKVRGLVAGMLERFDPTQMSVMATPTPGEVFDKENLQANKYEVFHGRHRLAALKHLESKGLLGNLLGMERAMLIVHIVNIDGSIQENYGSLRGNEIQSEWVRKPRLHELIYVLEEIKKTTSSERCLETLTRYGRLLSFGAEDITALRKICYWRDDGLSELCKCLKLFESLQTLDGKDPEFVRRKQSLLQKKDSIAFPNTWCRKLAKLDDANFLEMSPKIRNQEISFKDAIDDFLKMADRNHTMALVQKELGLLTVEEVNNNHPGKFNEKLLDSFSGAVIGKRSNNKLGDELKKYCTAVVLGFDEVKLKCVTDASRLKASELTNFDTIVFNVSRLTTNLVLKVESLRKGNENVSVILLFDRQDDQLIMFSHMKISKEKSLNAPIRICFTRKAPIVSENVREILIQGIVLTVINLQEPLTDFNGPLSSIDKVVHQVSPPDANLAFVNEGSLEIVNIHSLHPCQYFGDKFSLENFKSSLGNLSIDIIDAATEQNCSKELCEARIDEVGVENYEKSESSGSFGEVRGKEPMPNLSLNLSDSYGVKFKALVSKTSASEVDNSCGTISGPEFQPQATSTMIESELNDSNMSTCTLNPENTESVCSSSESLEIESFSLLGKVDAGAGVEESRGTMNETNEPAKDESIDQEKAIERITDECMCILKCRIVAILKVEERSAIIRVEDGTCSSVVSVEYRGEDTMEEAGNNKHFIDIWVTDEAVVAYIVNQSIQGGDWLRIEGVTLKVEESGDLTPVFRFILAKGNIEKFTAVEAACMTKQLNKNTKET